MVSLREKNGVEAKRIMEVAYPQNIDVMMDCDGLILSQEGDVYPHNQFESMHYGFIL